MNKFPEHFVFGAATAAFQAEGALLKGNRGKNYWDDYLKEQGMFDPSLASDFYHKYPEDLELCRTFGTMASYFYCLVMDISFRCRKI